MPVMNRSEDTPDIQLWVLLAVSNVIVMLSPGIGTIGCPFPQARRQFTGIWDPLMVDATMTVDPHVPHL
jgi:hypothetical protein